MGAPCGVGCGDALSVLPRVTPLARVAAATADDSHSVTMRTLMVMSHKSETTEMRLLSQNRLTRKWARSQGERRPCHLRPPQTRVTHTPRGPSVSSRLPRTRIRRLAAASASAHPRPDRRRRRRPGPPPPRRREHHRRATSSAAPAPGKGHDPDAPVATWSPSLDEPAATYEGSVTGLPAHPSRRGQEARPRQRRGREVPRPPRRTHHDAALSAVGATKIYDYSRRDQRRHRRPHRGPGTSPRRPRRRRRRWRRTPCAPSTPPRPRPSSGSAPPAGCGASSAATRNAGTRHHRRRHRLRHLAGERRPSPAPRQARRQQGQPDQGAQSACAITWAGDRARPARTSPPRTATTSSSARATTSTASARTTSPRRSTSPRVTAAATARTPPRPRPATRSRTSSSTAPTTAPPPAWRRARWSRRTRSAGRPSPAPAPAASTPTPSRRSTTPSPTASTSSTTRSAAPARPARSTAVELAYLRAARAGVFVANSAGNSGPGRLHPGPPEPVADHGRGQHLPQRQPGRRSSATVPRFVGASLTATLPTQTPLVALDRRWRSPTADPTEAALCFPGTLDPAKAAGKVVQCDRGVIARIDKSFEVKRAGGVGMILTNTSPNSLNGDLHAVPSVHLQTHGPPGRARLHRLRRCRRDRGDRAARRQRGRRRPCRRSPRSPRAGRRPPPAATCSSPTSAPPAST